MVSASGSNATGAKTGVRVLAWIAGFLMLFLTGGYWKLSSTIDEFRTTVAKQSGIMEALGKQVDKLEARLEKVAERIACPSPRPRPEHRARPCSALVPSAGPGAGPHGDGVEQAARLVPGPLPRWQRRRQRCGGPRRSGGTPRPDRRQALHAGSFAPSSPHGLP